MSEYAERDIIEQEDYYVRHINAMTKEGLHSKSDIAAELAHRDISIFNLEQQLKAAKHEAVEQYLEGQLKSLKLSRSLQNKSPLI